MGHQQRLDVCLHIRIYSFGMLPLGTLATLPERPQRMRSHVEEMQGALAEFPVEKSHLSYPSQHHVEQKDYPQTPENKLFYAAKL